jgi:hypothetical protein
MYGSGVAGMIVLQKIRLLIGLHFIESYHYNQTGATRPFQNSKLKIMTTTEIIANFMKGGFKVSISEKQKIWLIGQAKREGIPVSFLGDAIYFEDCYYKIQQCPRLCSGGSYVGTRIIQGRYNIEKLYTIKFDNGNTFVYDHLEVERIRREGYEFEIIKPHIHN